jgi:hypothetical protein
VNRVLAPHKFWQVDYISALQRKEIRTNDFDLTSYWVYDPIVLPSPPFPPGTSIPKDWLTPTRWWSGNTTPVPLQGPFPVDPQAGPSWMAQQLPAINCQSGRYTLLLDVEDTTGAHYYDTQQVWVDNKEIHGKITQLGGVPACATINLSQFAAAGGDCSVPWVANLMGIAYDELIEEGNFAIPSDNYAMVGGVVQGGYALWIKKDGAPDPGIQLPCAGPAAMNAPNERHAAGRRPRRSLRDRLAAARARRAGERRRPCQHRPASARRGLQPRRARPHARAARLPVPGGRVLRLRRHPARLGLLGLSSPLRGSTPGRAPLPVLYLQRPRGAARGSGPVTHAAAATRFAVAALAAWRVTHLLANEDGPGDAIVRLRARLGASRAGGLMDCFQCLSMWVAAPLSLFVARDSREALPTWLALSGAACLLERVGGEPVIVEAVEPALGGETDGVLWPEAGGVDPRAGVTA